MWLTISASARASERNLRNWIEFGIIERRVLTAMRDAIVEYLSKQRNVRLSGARAASRYTVHRVQTTLRCGACIE